MKVLLLILLVISAPLFANTPKLKSGDIILLPMTCYLCKMIEAETGGPYSHSGVIIREDSGELLVLQSLGSVHSLPLSEFLKMKDPGRDVMYLRPHEFVGRDMTAKMLAIFKSDFEGAPFDHDYLWDNYSPSGEEIYYCSEFITKFTNRFLRVKLAPERTYYYVYPKYWEKYFNGKVPNGVIGNNPNTFLKYHQLGQLNSNTRRP
ncbi:MAG: hypothetical protein KAG61_05740 [Bacteriovoracaceae bacterium]|nr:hypothetical protein [Bacteriovoracaceae bacterium]